MKEVSTRVGLMPSFWCRQTQKKRLWRLQKNISGTKPGLNDNLSLWKDFSHPKNIDEWSGNWSVFVTCESVTQEL
jgi:hypothetical protein